MYIYIYIYTYSHIIPKIMPFLPRPSKKLVRVIEVHLLNVGDQLAIGAKDLGQTVSLISNSHPHSPSMVKVHGKLPFQGHVRGYPHKIWPYKALYGTVPPF